MIIKVRNRPVSVFSIMSAISQAGNDKGVPESMLTLDVPDFTKLEGYDPNHPATPEEQFMRKIKVRFNIPEKEKEEKEKEEEDLEDLEDLEDEDLDQSTSSSRSKMSDMSTSSNKSPGSARKKLTNLRKSIASNKLFKLLFHGKNVT